MSEIKRPGSRTLYEAEGAIGDDVWEIPPSDPDEAADLIAEALAAAGDVTGGQKCTHACGCDEPAVWRVRYRGCRSVDCAGHVTCQAHLREREPLDHVVRLEGE